MLTNTLIFLDGQNDAEVNKFLDSIDFAQREGLAAALDFLEPFIVKDENGNYKTQTKNGVTTYVYDFGNLTAQGLLTLKGFEDGVENFFEGAIYLYDVDSAHNTSAAFQYEFPEFYSAGTTTDATQTIALWNIQQKVMAPSKFKV